MQEAIPLFAASIPPYEEMNHWESIISKKKLKEEDINRGIEQYYSLLR